jgi:hypothetical protein
MIPFQTNTHKINQPHIQAPSFIIDFFKFIIEIERFIIENGNSIIEMTYTSNLFYQKRNVILEYSRLLSE